jgi:hypothetical protein
MIGVTSLVLQSRFSVSPPDCLPTGARSACFQQAEWTSAARITPLVRLKGARTGVADLRVVHEDLGATVAAGDEARTGDEAEASSREPRHCAACDGFPLPSGSDDANAGGLRPLGSWFTSNSRRWWPSRLR